MDLTLLVREAGAGIALGSPSHASGYRYLLTSST